MDIDSLYVALLQMVADERIARRADARTAAVIRRAAAHHAVACTMVGIDLDVVQARASATPDGVQLTIDLHLHGRRRD